MTTKTDKCGSCRFYFGYGSTCRRYPPSPIFIPGTDLGRVITKQRMTAAWPYVDENDWCGEFKERE